MPLHLLPVGERGRRCRRVGLGHRHVGQPRGIGGSSGSTSPSRCASSMIRAGDASSDVIRRRCSYLRRSAAIWASSRSSLSWLCASTTWNTTALTSTNTTPSDHDQRTDRDRRATARAVPRRRAARPRSARRSVVGASRRRAGADAGARDGGRPPGHRSRSTARRRALAARGFGLDLGRPTAGAAAG